MTEQTRYLVTLPLTDEQEATFRRKMPYLRDALRAIGTPVAASGLETVCTLAWRLPDTIDSIIVFKTAAAAREYEWTDDHLTDVVLRADAESQIAIRDARIAALEAERDRIAQETREVCAEVCDTRYGKLFDKWEVSKSEEDFFCMGEANNCAAAIRSAGEKA